jgi:hypothetical protein
MNALHTYQERAPGIEVSRIEIKGNAQHNKRSSLLMYAVGWDTERERKINILRETLAPGQCNYFSIHQNTLKPLKLNMFPAKAIKY